MRRLAGAAPMGIGLVVACAAAGPPPTYPELRLKLPTGVALTEVCVGPGPERCFDARDDNCNGVIDEGCGVRTGMVQFVIAWPSATADVDLEVTDPNGELVEPGRVTESGLVKEGDCPGSRGECHGQNLENVYLEGAELTRGAYRVVLRLESMGREVPPIRVTLGVRVGPRTYGTEVSLGAVGEEKSFTFEL